MAAQSSAGIQTLLEAEKEAAKIVQKARQYRVQRLKDARSEAAKDIESLKSQKQGEFGDFEKQYLGSSDESVSKVTADTDNQLKTIEATYNQNKQIVLDKILAQVIKVNPEMHINSLNPKGY